MLDNIKLYELLGLEILTSITRVGSRGRGLEDIIRKVSPNPGKRGRPLKEQVSLPQSIIMPPIPKLFDISSTKINSNAMRLAIITISQVLALQCKKSKVFHHPIIAGYKSLTSPLFEVFIDGWISEGLENL